ncbi:protease inhibitor I42 family protein [Undibacterium sp. RuTC16W]|uniref:protease inhibitor I42 family protein n=1 Tax=Undibacterium sp. RuTC16W TaxID=3413048 RepID=UPI003BF45CBB
MTTENHIVEGIEGDDIALPLGTSSATGFHWDVDLPAGLSFVDKSPVNTGRDAEDATEAGGGPAQQLSVNGVAGIYQISAKLIRPWDKANPIRHALIQLTIKPVS